MAATATAERRGGEGERQGGGAEPAALDEAFVRSLLQTSAEGDRLLRQIEAGLYGAAQPGQGGEEADRAERADRIVKAMGEGLADAVAFLDTVPLDADIAAACAKATSEIEKDTKSKLAQIGKADARLAGQEDLVRASTDRQALACEAYWAWVSVERQKEALQARHWHEAAGRDRYGLAGRGLDPSSLLAVEDDAKFYEECAKRLSIVALDAVMQEYGATGGRTQGYLNSPFQFVLLSRGKIESHMRTATGKTNVSWWSTNNPISLFSAMRVGDALGKAVLFFYESPVTVREKFEHPDIESTLDPDEVAGRLGGLGHSATLKAKEAVEASKLENDLLRVAEEREPDVLAGVARHLHEQFGTMSTVPRAEGIGAGVTDWVKAHWKALTLVTAGATAGVVLLKLYGVV